MPDERTDEEAEILDIYRDDPEQRADEERERAIKANFRHEMLLAQMQNREFRAWLMEKLTAFGTFGHSFGASPAGVPDPLATWFALGMKAAGWALWEEFDGLTPEWASVMRREAAATKDAKPAAPQRPPADGADGADAEVVD